MYIHTYSGVKKRGRRAAETKAKSQIIILLCMNLPVLSTLAKFDKTGFVCLRLTYLTYLTHTRRIKFIIKRGPNFAQRCAMGNFCADNATPRSPPPDPHKTSIQNFLNLV